MNNVLKQTLTLISVITICFVITSANGCTQTGSSSTPIYTSNLPAYSTLESTYKRYGVNTPANLEISDPELGDLLGGYVEYNIDANIFVNTCAIRVSDMLNKSGETIPYISGETSSSADGDKHIFRVVQLNLYMTDKYGSPQINSTNLSDFTGHKGIILFDMPGVWSDATGHTALWDGYQTLGGYINDQFLFDNSQSIKLWVAN